MARITFHVVKLSRENRKMDFILKILTGRIFVRSWGVFRSTEGHSCGSPLLPDMGGHRDAKVVIIGCGIAGIAAAQKLVKAGFHHVRILEATGRSGGRIKTGRIGE